MATRLVLGELAAGYEQRTGIAVEIESVGGVDAAKRVAAGEPFDAVLLASDAIAKLEAAGHVAAGSRVDLFRSGVAVAVRAGAPAPDIASEEALKRAVLAARSVSLSTGPSGVALAKLFERWGIAGEIAPRMVQAPPGVPVGSLVARGEVELGFQQLSELRNLEGIQVLGALPEPVRIVTTFSGAVCTASTQGAQVRALLQYFASPGVEETKRRHGMEPA